MAPPSQGTDPSDEAQESAALAIEKPGALEAIEQESAALENEKPDALEAISIPEIRHESGKKISNKYEEINYTNKIKENFHKNGEAEYDDKQFMVENEETEEHKIEYDIQTETS